MVTVNAAMLQNLVNESTTLTATKAEVIEDQAINLLNVYGATLDNLTGTAGTKTGTYTSKQAGAIMNVAVCVYSFSFKGGGSNSSSQSIGSLSISESSSSNSSQTINDVAKQQARFLMGATFERT